MVSLLSLACSEGGGPATDGGGGGRGGGGSGGSSTNPPSEEGTSDPPGGDAGSTGPLPGQKRVFATASRYGADLKTAGRAASGLAGGDALCKTAADAANLGGSWKAWLSVGVPGGAGAATHAIDRIADVGPWYRTDGAKAFNNKANLMTAPLVPLHYDENGRRILVDGEVWTGTEIGGRWTGQDCDQWTLGFNSKTGTAGEADAQNEKWTVSLSWACGSTARLYCIEQ